MQISQIKSWFLHQGLALFCAIIVGGLSVAPHVVAVRSIGSAYRGIPFMYLDDEDLYLARIHEIVDGHWRIGSPFLAEYKSFVPPLLPIGEFFYVAIASVTRLSLSETIVLTKFLFPAALFFLVYLFIRRLTDDEKRSGQMNLTAISGALLVTLAYDFISPKELFSWLRGADIGLHLSIWTRPVNPITGGLLLFGWLLVIWEIAHRRRFWFVVPAGILQAAMVGYFFSWGIATALTFVLAAFYLIRKNWKVVRDLGIAFAVSVLASLPYWIGVFHSVGGMDGKRLSERNGMLFTHMPLLNKTLLATLAFFLIMTYADLRARKKKINDLLSDDAWIVTISLLVAGLGALNQQILTGRAVWPYHFVQYTKPFAMIALIVIGDRLLRTRARTIWTGVYVSLVAFALVNGLVPITESRFMLEDFRARQQNADLFNWLDANEPKDCVVLVREPVPKLEWQIPAFTHCNVYVSSYVFYGVPDERSRHNLFVFLAIHGVKPADAETYLREHSDVIRSFVYDNWNQMLGKTPDAWTDAMAVELAKGYEEFSKQPLAVQLKKYRLDIIVSDGPIPGVSDGFVYWKPATK